MSAPDLSAAASAVELAQSVVKSGVRTLAAADGGVDANQVLAYDLAHAAADLATKVFGREAAWGAAEGALDELRPFVSTYRDPAFLAELGGEEGPRHLDPDFE